MGKGTRTQAPAGAAAAAAMAEEMPQSLLEQLQRPPDGETLRIMVATDNHVGYAERDPVRGKDSFAALEEIFIRAKQFKVDMVLLGGDLFHDNKPSRKTLHQTISILRQYCLGEEPVAFEVVSDQTRNFDSSFGQVNYEDPNYAVGLPVFCIHGNHDDPSREGATEPLSALDLLSINNLVNYFGKTEASDNVEVNPVLLRKGSETSVALYGLGNMRDERLNRMWNKKKVKFLRHRGTTEEHRSEFFSIFVIHQNRDYGRGSKNCVHESMIPDWMDLVIWGHEHECLIKPTPSLVGGFYVSQPGSSVATSLVEGEAEPKQVGILEIRGGNFRMYPVPLQQVRPFILRELRLGEVEGLDPSHPKVEEHVTQVLEERVQQMIEEARVDFPPPEPLPGQKLTLDHPEQVLVRLKVEYTGFFTLNNQRFGQRFVGQVANPGDILLFHKSRKLEGGGGPEPGAKGRKRGGVEHKEEMAGTLERLDVKVEDLVRREIEASEKKLTLLNEPELYLALDDFVNKNTTSAIADVVEDALEKTQKELKKNPEVKGEAESILEAAAAIQAKARRKAEGQLRQLQQEEEEAAAAGKGKGRKGSKAADGSESESGMASEGLGSLASASVASRGKGRKGAGGGKGRGRQESDAEESEALMGVSGSEEEDGGSSASGGRGKGKKAAAGKKKAGATTAKAASGRGARGGKATAVAAKGKGAKGKGGKRGAAALDSSEEEEDDEVVVMDEDSDSDVVEVLSKASASGPRRKAPARAATTKRKATKYFDDEVEEEDEFDESLSEPGDSVSGVFEEEDEEEDSDDDFGGGGGRGKGKGKGKKGAAAATKKRKPAATPASAAAKRKPAAAASSSVSSRALPPWMAKPQAGGASQGGKGRARGGEVAATATAPRAASSGTNEEVDFDLEALSRNA